LRFGKSEIMLVNGGQQDAEQSSRLGNVQVCSVWVVPSQMEIAMYKAIIGTLAIVATAALVSGGAEAGGSASAASKYAHSSQTASVRTQQAARTSNVAITEYSSSSAKRHGAKYR
jgi:hypothetical protein